MCCFLPASAFLAPPPPPLLAFAVPRPLCLAIACPLAADSEYASSEALPYVESGLGETPLLQALPWLSPIAAVVAAAA
jgi:hypothetical protein